MKAVRFSSRLRFCRVAIIALLSFASHNSVHAQCAAIQAPMPSGVIQVVTTQQSEKSLKLQLEVGSGDADFWEGMGFNVHFPLVNAQINPNSIVRVLSSSAEGSEHPVAFEVSLNKQSNSVRIRMPQSGCHTFHLQGVIIEIVIENVTVYGRLAPPEAGELGGDGYYDGGYVISDVIDMMSPTNKGHLIPLQRDEMVSVYPNPLVGSTLSVKIESLEIGQVAVHDIYGRIVEEIPVTKVGVIEIDLEHLPRGQFILIASGPKICIAKKFVK